jgi:hypothetical protein
MVPVDCCSIKMKIKIKIKIKTEIISEGKVGRRIVAMGSHWNH